MISNGNGVTHKEKRDKGLPMMYRQALVFVCAVGAIVSIARGFVRLWQGAWAPGMVVSTKGNPLANWPLSATSWHKAETKSPKYHPVYRRLLQVPTRGRRRRGQFG